MDWPDSNSENDRLVSGQSIHMGRQSSVQPEISSQVPTTTTAVDAHAIDMNATDSGVEINTRTGRPIRKSAGKRDFSSLGYVQDIAPFEDTDDDASMSGSDSPCRKHSLLLSDDGGSSNEVNGKRRVSKIAKNKATARSTKGASPSPPRSPSPALEDYTRTPAASPTPRPSITPEPEPDKIFKAQLTFNVPTGHEGPFIVNLDMSSLLSQGNVINSEGGLARQPEREPSPKGHYVTSPTALRSLSKELRQMARKRSKYLKAIQKTKPKPDPKLGFLGLPAELRNKIYRLLFVIPGGVETDFIRKDNLSRSAGFLSTCKQIHQEGSSVLYGENRFHFGRVSYGRGKFYEKEWAEIGYKDLKRFLVAIGPRNVSQISSIILRLEDGTPSGNPGLSHQERRFINDSHLQSCLRQLGNQGKLKSLELEVGGRSILTEAADKFLAALETITHLRELHFVGHVWHSIYSGEPKMRLDLQLEMMLTMLA